MNLMIENSQDKFNAEDISKIIEIVVKKVVEHEEINTDCQISIVLVDNNEIREINRTYRKIDSATDVLSFPMMDYDDTDHIENDTDKDLDTGELVLGDIAISLERAHEQSIEYGHSFEREIAFLTVHGMLHLLGYDHEAETDRKIMREREDSILKQLNINR